MLRFSLKLFFLFCLCSIIFLALTSFTSEVLAQSCSNWYEPIDAPLPCVNNTPIGFDKNCVYVGGACQINPFCTKYSGTECCTGTTSSGPIPGSTFHYDYCDARYYPSDNYYQSMQCCYNIPTDTSTPECNATIVCSTAGTCTASANTCSVNNGTRTNTNCKYTAYSGGGDCTQVAAPNQTASCTVNNCDTDKSCVNGLCVIPTTAPTTTPTPFPCSGEQNGLWYNCFSGACLSGWSESARNDDPGGTTCVGSSICCYQNPPTTAPTGPPGVTPTDTPTSAPGAPPILSGHVFDDENRNGVKDGSETDYGEDINLRLSWGSPSESETITTSYWARTGTAGEDYTLTLTLPATYRATSANPVTITNLSGSTEINFGITNYCEVTTLPSVHNLNLTTIKFGTVTASVTSGLGTATINQMRFGSYNTAIATVSPTSDSSSIYSTTVTAVAGGSTAVWGTADLDDNGDGVHTDGIDRKCQSTGTTDTDINVSGPTTAPTATPTSAPGATATPAPTAAPTPVPGAGIVNIGVFKDLNGTGDPAGQLMVPGVIIQPLGCPWNSEGQTMLDSCWGFEGWNMPTNSSGFARFNKDEIKWNSLFYACKSSYYDDLDYRERWASHPLSIKFIIGGGAFPPGWRITTPGPPDQYILKFNSSRWGCASDTRYFGIAPPLYSISGKIFNDANGDGKSTADSNYEGTFTVASTGGTVTKPAPAGNYLVSGLPAGSYTIAFSGLPSESDFTFPQYNFGCPENARNCVTVTVGSGCSVPVTSEASCSSGNIINLNAGVTELKDQWFQSIGADMRWDSGFNNPLPSADTYASLPGLGGMPGIIFSGATAPKLGLGKASDSPFNWQVGSIQNPDIYTTSHAIIPTSYRFLLGTAEGSGITLNSSISSLDEITSHGIYKAQDLFVSSAGYTFPANQNFIILVEGDMRILGKIEVPVGSTAIFSVKGNIEVKRGVGEIEGLYSADGSFIAEGYNSCPTVDKRLNIAGTVIANAGRQGGTFQNRRTLCAGNTVNPSVTFIERPDFMLNYPSMIKQTSRTWRDEAP